MNGINFIFGTFYAVFFQWHCTPGKYDGIHPNLMDIQGFSRLSAMFGFACYEEHVESGLWSASLRRRRPNSMRRVKRFDDGQTIEVVYLVRQQLYSTSFFANSGFSFFSGVSTSQRTQFNLLWISERHFWYSIDLSKISLQSTINWQKRHCVNQIICLWESRKVSLEVKFCLNTFRYSYF